MSEYQFMLILANVWFASSSKSHEVGLVIGLFYLVFGIVIGFAK